MLAQTLVSSNPGLTAMRCIEVLESAERNDGPKVGMLCLDGQSEVGLDPKVDLPVAVLRSRLIEGRGIPTGNSETVRASNQMFIPQMLCGANEYL